MKSVVVALVSLTILVVLLLAVASETYILVADGPLYLRRNLGEPDSKANVIAQVRAGQELKVTGCIDYKSDIAVQVRLDEQIGYISDGDFHVMRLPWRVRFASFDLDSVVWSCHGFFNNRKIEG